MSVHNLVEFKETKTCLEITVHPEHVDDVEECEDFYDVLDYQFGNGWERILPEECGALTDGLIITRHGERNDKGELTKLGTVYWDESYAVKNLLDELKEKGKCTMKRCDWRLFDSLKGKHMRKAWSTLRLADLGARKKTMPKTNEAQQLEKAYIEGACRAKVGVATKALRDAMFGVSPEYGFSVAERKALSTALDCLSQVACGDLREEMKCK